MSEASLVQSWLHRVGPQGAPSDEDVSRRLAEAGVHTAPLPAGAPPSGLVVLLCPDLSTRVCNRVRELAGGDRCRVLAVTTAEAMAGTSAWQVLAAGAADVLAWDAQHAAGTIAARLRRWADVEATMSSPLVRDHLVGGGCGCMFAVLRQAVEVARFTDASVLLVGETGTGKELVARLIHTLSSPRGRHDLVVLDCTTIVPDLSGSELFGHERGAFTGAIAPRDGAFALADGGTLFLDEVGELPLGLQAQLLRVIQERTYKRVGSNIWRETDFRLVCASNRDLLEEVEQGRFRRDLYYRIASWVFRLPPLRERPEDILPLVNHFIQEMRPGEEPLTLDVPVQAYLRARHYPGNVRDLRNLVQRLVHRHVGHGPITIGDIPMGERIAFPAAQGDWRDRVFEQAVARAVLGGAGLDDIKSAAEEIAIQTAVGLEEGSLDRAANRLGRTRRALEMRRAKERHRSVAVVDDNNGHGEAHAQGSAD